MTSTATTTSAPLTRQVGEASSRGMLSALDLACFGNLYLVAKTLVDGLYQGRHATPERGGSTEFFDYRMWVDGESAQGIDWKVFGRSDRLFVRRFQHFGNLTLQVIVDGSASMNYGGGAGSVTKWEYASQLAAALSLLAIRQSEQVALAIAVDAVRASIPVGSAFSHLYRVIHLLEDFEPRGQEELRLALQQAQQMLPRRRVIFVLSDFLGEVAELTDAVQQLRFHGNDVICLQILTPSERDLEGLADGRFVDCENPQQAVVTEIDQVRQAYTQLMGEHVEAVEQNLRGCGAGHFLIKTDEHPLTVLRRVLAKR